MPIAHPKFMLSDSRKTLQGIFKKYFADCHFDNFLPSARHPLVFISYYNRFFTASIHHTEVEKNHLGHNGVPGSVKKLIQLRLLNELRAAKEMIEEDIERLRKVCE